MYNVEGVYTKVLILTAFQ